MKILWAISISLLFVGGIYLSFCLEFSHFKFSFSNLFKGDNNSSISPFASLMITLGSRIGVGSLAGISLAIFYGGVGSIFWIWITTLITSANSYVETYLGSKFRRKENNGPWNYMENGVDSKGIARFYALLIILAYLFGFIMIQGNTITNALHYYFDFNKFYISVILIFITYFCLRKGLVSISSFLEKLVPFMGLIYIIISYYIIISNYSIILKIISNIICSAFNIKSFFSGFLIGVQRGVFASESGLGSSVIASSAVEGIEPHKNALIQVIGVLFTTFVICTATAFIILTSNVDFSIFSNINGIEIIQYSLQYHLGNFGIIVLTFLIISFAFSTIIGGYFYGETAFKYLFNVKSSNLLLVLKIVMIILLFMSCYIKSSFLWFLVDLFVALMTIINMFFLLKMSNVFK